MADYASVTRLTQTGFNEGVQELNVYMDNDTAIPQQWKWPDCRHEGDAGSFSLHDIYVRLFEAGMDPDELYLFVTTSAKQVGGKTLSQAAPQPSAEATDEDVTVDGSDEEVGGGDDTGADDIESGGDGTGGDDTSTSEDAGSEEPTKKEGEDEEQEEQQEEEEEEKNNKE